MQGQVHQWFYQGNKGTKGYRGSYPPSAGASYPGARQPKSNITDKKSKRKQRLFFAWSPCANIACKINHSISSTVYNKLSQELPHRQASVCMQAAQDRTHRLEQAPTQNRQGRVTLLPCVQESGGNCTALPVWMSSLLSWSIYFSIHSLFHHSIFMFTTFPNSLDLPKGLFMPCIIHLPSHHQTWSTMSSQCHDSSLLPQLILPECFYGQHTSTGSLGHI